MQSFERATGPKADRWLVQTAGVLITVIGATLLYAARRDATRPGPNCGSWAWVTHDTLALFLSAASLLLTALHVRRASLLLPSTCLGWVSVLISVTPPSRTVTGTEEITYTNRSPYPLPALILRTYLDVHKPEAPRDQPVLDSFYSEGIQVDEFKVNGEVKPWPGTLAPTLVQLKLDEPLQPNSSITLSISWRYELADAKSLAGGLTWKVRVGTIAASPRPSAQNVEA